MTESDKKEVADATITLSRKKRFQAPAQLKTPKVMHSINVTEPRVLLILLWLLCLEKLTFTSSSHKADNRCKQKLTGMSEF